MESDAGIIYRVRKLRVLVLMHDYLVPPADVTGIDVETAPWRTEHDVVKTLRDDLEHDVHVLGVKDDLAGIRQANDELKLRLAVSEDQARQEFTVLLTVQTMNHLHSGGHRLFL